MDQFPDTVVSPALEPGTKGIDLTNTDQKPEDEPKPEDQPPPMPDICEPTPNNGGGGGSGGGGSGGGGGGDFLSQLAQMGQQGLQLAQHIAFREPLEVVRGEPKRAEYVRSVHRTIEIPLLAAGQTAMPAQQLDGLLLGQTL